MEVKRVHAYMVIKTLPIDCGDFLELTESNILPGTIHSVLTASIILFCFWTHKQVTYWSRKLSIVL